MQAMNLLGNGVAITPELLLYVKLLVVVVVAFFVIHLTARLVHRFLRALALPPDSQVFLRKAVYYGLWFAVALYIIAELHLGEILYPLLGASVLVGAAVALAVKDALSDAVAGLFLLADRHFNIGDEITTMGQRGEIIDVTLRKTRLKTEEGIIVVVANGKIDSSGWVLHQKETERSTSNSPALNPRT